MIYDCFMFFNELELLEIRLNELSGVVDKFVLVEATKTFSNKPKPLYYENNKERYSNFKDRIIHIIVDDSPDTDNPWVLDHYQKNCIQRGLVDAKPQDVIIISDADEIPKAKTVSALLKNLKYDTSPFYDVARYIIKKNMIRRYFKRIVRNYNPFIYVFQQKPFYYYLNLAATVHSQWYGTRLLFYRDFTLADEVRYSGYKIVKDGGWHFSYMGGAQRIAQKIKSFAHSELDKPQYTNTNSINELIKNKRLLSDPSEILKPVPVDESFPRYIVENQSKYKDWILPVK